MIMVMIRANKTGLSEGLSEGPSEGRSQADGEDEDNESVRLV